MEERFKTYGYKITTDPQFQNKRFGITPELNRQLESLAIKCQDPKDKKIIERLNQLVIQYPRVPMLKNYLTVAYNVQGNHRKAFEVNNWLIDEHPDYLFAKLNQANVCIDEGDFDKVPGILGEAMDIKQLYPDREVFHLSEVTGFLKLTIRYFATIENLKMAENRLEILKEIAPEHHDTKQAEYFIMPLRLKKAGMRWEEENEKWIVPKTVKSNLVTNSKDAPEFNHPEIDKLYRYGLRIPHEILKEILDLPRQSLIADLEMVIQDSVKRYDYFTELEYEEETHSFVLHALFLLKELMAVESLPIIFAVLSSDDEYLEFWLGDHRTESVWQCLYQLGYNAPGVFKEFLLKPGIDTFSKTAVSEALSQMVLHHPEKREQVAAIYSEVFTLFSEASLEDNLIDSEFLGLAICNIINCRMKELLSVIQILYEKGYVLPDICGKFKDVEKAICSPSINQYQRNLYTIFELYDHVIT